MRVAHGHSAGRRTGAYRSWQAMINRCECSTTGNYYKYGAKGVKVCERWHKYENFLEDMGDRPEGASLDRFPNASGNYEPGNCRWATMKQQNNNRTGYTVTVTAFGKTQTISAWAEEYGLNYTTISERLRKSKWTPEDAVSKPPWKGSKQ